MKSENLSLNQAISAKRDEFYTQYEDIEAELKNYKEYFEGKRVFCNCDDPFESNFIRYFIGMFNELRLQELIATCYAGSCIAGTQIPLKIPYYMDITSVPYINNDVNISKEDMIGICDREDNKLVKLTEDGDFRSNECIQLLNKSDVVVTNPPFSLFRDYISLLVKYNKDYIIIGNINAVTYKEIIPLILNDKLWFGESISNGDRKFRVPDDYPLNASGCGIDDNGNRYIRVKGVRWFTNIDYGKRHHLLELNKSYDKYAYPKYDNYNAIEVNKVKNIPYDYTGLMGVPITFLDKYSPDQFKIISIANGNARTTIPIDILESVGYVATDGDRGGVCLVNGHRKYARLLIKHL